MKDKLHQILSVGDSVAFLTPIHKNMEIGKIIGFSKHQVRIQYHTSKKTTRYSNDVIKITDQLNIAKRENPEYFI